MKLAQYKAGSNDTMENVYMTLLQVLENGPADSWNASDLAIGFINQLWEIEHDNKTFQIDMETENEWKYFNGIIFLFSALLENPDLYDWSTRNIGSFFTQNLIGQFKAESWFSYYCKDMQSRIDETLVHFHNLFTLDGQEISIPDVGYIFSLTDFRELSEKHSTSFSYGHFSRMNLKKTFTICFDDVANQKKSIEQDSYYETTLEHSLNFSALLPCLNLEKYSSCREYCKWHIEYSKDIPKKEFLTIMKYAMPQRKIISNLFKSGEKDLAQRLFGASNIKQPNKTTSPISIPLFCHNKRVGFHGENIGFTSKVCDDFYPGPTDIGMCLTKNLELNKIVLDDPNYNEFLEFDSDRQVDAIEGGTLWSESTFIFQIENKDPLSPNYKMYPNANLKTMLFQLHQSNELGHFLTDTNVQKQNIPLTIKANTEYIIEVSPTGQISSESFKELDFHQRNCFLEKEVKQDSLFKIYTKNNCQYECLTKLARNKCDCIPWDFLHNIDANECDVFGRTCFYQSMEKLSQSPEELCNHCLEGCDSLIYEKANVKESSFVDFSGSTLMAYIRNVESGECFGSKTFCDFVLDKNDTLKDKGLKNALKALGFDSNYNKVLEKFSNIAVIRLRFLQPKFDVLDARYTAADRFANFGGLYGIYEEITGCSLLAILNLLIIIIKNMFCSKYQNRVSRRIIQN